MLLKLFPSAWLCETTNILLKEMIFAAFLSAERVEVTGSSGTCCSFHCLSSLNWKCRTWLLLATFRFMSCRAKVNIKKCHSASISISGSKRCLLTAWVRASPCRVSTPFTWSMLQTHRQEVSLSQASPWRHVEQCKLGSSRNKSTCFQCRRTASTHFDLFLSH